MQKFLTSFCLFLLIVFITIGCSINKENTLETLSTKKGNNQPAANTVTLTISAASSLRDAMTVIQRTYHKQHPEVKIQFNYGGAGLLKEQILDGTPTDLFISDSKKHLNELINLEYIEKEDSVDLFRNTLVLITSEEQSPLNSFRDLTLDKVETIVIGDPELVAAGFYAEEVLMKKDVWEPLQAKLSYAKDVRQVLSRVETGSAEAGIVYETDALHSDKVKIVDYAAPDTHSPIVYQAGILQDSQHYEQAKEFFRYLQTKEALQVFEEYGFIIVN